MTDDIQGREDVAKPARTRTVGNGEPRSFDPWDTREYRKFRQDTADIADAAREISGAVKLIKKHFWKVVALISVAYPTIGKLINAAAVSMNIPGATH